MHNLASCEIKHGRAPILRECEVEAIIHVKGIIVPTCQTQGGAPASPAQARRHRMGSPQRAAQATAEAAARRRRSRLTRLPPRAVQRRACAVGRPSKAPSDRCWRARRAGTIRWPQAASPRRFPLPVCRFPCGGPIEEAKQSQRQRGNITEGESLRHFEKDRSGEAFIFIDTRFENRGSMTCTVLT